MLKIETGKDNPVLRQVCEPIAAHEIQKYAKLGKEMLKYIKSPDHRGVGLAAPQVGVSKRILVASLLDDWEDEVYSTIVMINPEILEHSESITNDIFQEGCLSLPGTKPLYVDRYERIKVGYLDLKGKKKVIWIAWLASVIVQHEIDHLDGILYIDKISK